MKIVHIGLCGPVTDGWNYQDNMLTKYHSKFGYDVTMITSQWIWGTDGKLKKIEESNYINGDNVKMIRLPLKYRDKFSKKFKRYVGLKKALIQEKPDILFIHNVSFLDINTIVSYLKINKNVKVFVDNHSDYSNSATSFISKNILHKIIWRYMANKIEPYTSKFYGVLPARVDFLIDLYKIPKHKVELLVMGADDEKVEASKILQKRLDLRKKHGIDDNDFLIVTGGKIDEAKRQTLMLMDAVKQLNKNKVKLIVFGSVIDNLRDELDKLADGINIQYIGWINSEDSYEYFAAADLAVFPGRHSVFWEQVAGQGIPMICKYWEGTTHIDLGGNVLFLENDSSKDIYDALVGIIEDNKKYNNMLAVAQKMSYKFLYSNISRLSIGKEKL